MPSFSLASFAGYVAAWKIYRYGPGSIKAEAKFLITLEPDGITQYKWGYCLCNIPFANTVLHDIMASLPDIAAIGCDIMMKSISLVAEVGVNAIPGVGEAMDAGQAGVKALSAGGEQVCPFCNEPIRADQPPQPMP